MEQAQQAQQEQQPQETTTDEAFRTYEATRLKLEALTRCCLIGLVDFSRERRTP